MNFISVQLHLSAIIQFISGFQTVLFVHCVCMSEQYVNDVSLAKIYLRLSCDEDF